MKRTALLFEKICSMDNLSYAWIKAKKHKANKESVKRFSQNVKFNLEKIKLNLESPTPVFCSYTHFKIFDPKERIISVVPFSERVMHHAIINILEPVFEKQFIYHTYACRKNKGLHKAVQYVKNICDHNQNGLYFLKIDIKKFFDSIEHLVLKTKLSKIIKDEKCLAILFGIIDSYSVNDNKKGVPIGNLTSQFFANFYLSSFDHYVLEKLKPKGYVRYMDDMLIFEEKKEDIKVILYDAKKYLWDNLGLILKYSVIGKAEMGVPFLGRLIKSNSVDFLRIKKKRKQKKLSTIDFEYRIDRISLDKACERMFCVMNERKI